MSEFLSEFLYELALPSFHTQWRKILGLAPFAGEVVQTRDQCVQYNKIMLSILGHQN